MIERDLPVLRRLKEVMEYGDAHEKSGERVGDARA